MSEYEAEWSWGFVFKSSSLCYAPVDWDSPSRALGIAPGKGEDDSAVSSLTEASVLTATGHPVNWKVMFLSGVGHQERNQHIPKANLEVFFFLSIAQSEHKGGLFEWCLLGIWLGHSCSSAAALCLVLFLSFTPVWSHSEFYLLPRKICRGILKEVDLVTNRIFACSL